MSGLGHGHVDDGVICMYVRRRERDPGKEKGSMGGGGTRRGAILERVSI